MQVPYLNMDDTYKLMCFIFF